MRICIDLNDVIRDYTNNYIKYFNQVYERLPVDILEDAETNNLYEILPFANETAYNEFTYKNYVLELYGKVDTVDDKIKSRFNLWFNNTLNNLDLDEKVEVIFTSPMEYDLSIQSTYFFLSKIGTRVREIFFPLNSVEVWDRCDLLITANPSLLSNVPNNKNVIKINQPYNKHITSKYSYNSLSMFIEETDNDYSILENMLNDIKNA